MDTSSHVHHLDKKIHALMEAQARLGDSDDLKELLRIIHFPGWTTPAELALVLGMLDHMQGLVQQLARAQAELTAAAKQVGHQ